MNVNDDVNEVSDERIKHIREKPDHERTGEEQAVLGIDNAMTLAQEAMEKAGFEIDHLVLLFDVSESPDKNPDAPKMGMVIAPHHPECAFTMLAGSIASLVGSEEGVMRMIEQQGGSTPPGTQPGPLHHQ